MAIETEAALLRKRLEKLWRPLNNVTTLDKKKRKTKEEEIDILKEQLAGLEDKLTELRVTRLNIKLHMEVD